MVFSESREISTMTRYHKAIGVCFVAAFAVWGCTRAPSSQTDAHADKIKALEAKTARLEDDLKAALTVNEQLRKKIGDFQESQTQLQQEIDRLQLVVKERDELKAHLKTRTAERDLTQAKYEGFLKELDDLTGRAKAALQSKPANTGVASGDSAGPALPSGS
jgi:TolA-binding protein